MILTISTYGLIGDSAIDIQNHDTYYVVNYVHLLLILVMTYALLGGVYWLFSAFKLNFLLIGLHILLSLVPLFGITYSAYTFLKTVIPRRYYSFATYDFIGFNPFDSFSQMGFIFCIAQILLILNLILGYKKYNIQKLD